MLAAAEGSPSRQPTAWLRPHSVIANETPADKAHLVMHDEISRSPPGLVGDRRSPTGERWPAAADELRRSERFEAAARTLGEEHMDLRMDGLGQRLLAQMDALDNEMLAAFRGELVTAIAPRTGVMVITTVAAVFGIGALAVTLSQVL